jgi:DNA-directed RNA polymerase specialized sigma24 family protein
MSENIYKGIIDDWKVNLIETRAKRFGICRHDLEDAQQEIALEILSFRFDSTKANGACERTVLTSLVDRQLMTLLRCKRRYTQHVQAQGCHASEEETEPFTEPISQQQLELDVREAVTRLSAEEQVVCQTMANGHSIAETARQLGRSWHKVNRIVRQIRKQFEFVGLAD